MSDAELQTRKVMYGATPIEFRLERRDRGTLEISVEPDTLVKVVAPFDASLDAIMEKVKKRGDWILRQIRYFEELPPKQPAREFRPGETHYYLGKSYRLKFVAGDTEGILIEGPLFLVQGTRDPVRIESMFRQWYRSRSNEVLTELVDHWFPRMNLGSKKPIIQIRKMEKRWGSCTSNGSIIFNEDLIKAPKSCIEYVVLHELCHLVEANHGQSFFNLLSFHLPDWNARKNRLEAGVEGGKNG